MAKGRTPKERGTNPRAKGTNPRAKGTNPLGSEKTKYQRRSTDLPRDDALSPATDPSDRE